MNEVASANPVGRVIARPMTDAACEKRLLADATADSRHERLRGAFS